MFLFINKVDVVACVLSKMVLYPVQIGLVEPEALKRRSRRRRRKREDKRDKKQVKIDFIQFPHATFNC